MTGVKKDTLPNGLTVVTESMPSVRSVTLGIWLRTGSRHEPGEQNGIVHFLEHMVFKGTENRSAEEIARTASTIGGHLDAFLVGPRIERALDFEPGRCRRRADQFDHGEMVCQRPAAPVLRNLAEPAVRDLVPL